MQKKINLIILILASLILFFVALKINASSIDIAINNYFQNIQNNSGIKIMEIISNFGDFWFLSLVSIFVIFILYKKKKWKNLLFYLLVLIGVFIGKFLKEIFQIPRPINLIETGFGFPSLHAIGSFLIYGIISYFLFKNKKRVSSILILLLPILISFSRLYLNVHWFSDIVGGIAFGFLWFFLILFFYSYFVRNKPKHL